MLQRPSLGPPAASAGAAWITGIGELTASAMTASVGDFAQLSRAARGVAGRGAQPELRGGKASHGRITKRGDDYLRTLMIQGAKSAVMSAHKRSDPISRWLVQLKRRVGRQKAGAQHA